MKRRNGELWQAISVTFGRTLHGLAINDERREIISGK